MLSTLFHQVSTFLYPWFHAYDLSDRSNHSEYRIWILSAGIRTAPGSLNYQLLREGFHNKSSKTAMSSPGLRWVFLPMDREVNKLRRRVGAPERWKGKWFGWDESKNTIITEALQFTFDRMRTSIPIPAPTPTGRVGEVRNSEVPVEAPVNVGPYPSVGLHTIFAKHLLYYFNEIEPLISRRHRGSHTIEPQDKNQELPNEPTYSEGITEAEKKFLNVLKPLYALHHKKEREGWQLRDHHISLLLGAFRTFHEVLDNGRVKSGVDSEVLHKQRERERVGQWSDVFLKIVEFYSNVDAGRLEESVVERNERYCREGKVLGSAVLEGIDLAAKETVDELHRQPLPEGSLRTY
ncbi:hypothetical protein BJ508DRAFT_310405 [Ascobolus immersus RN42]|uniref:Uncharacterized protein n=1 Tax=Ascobolus immersus RN42 TaxID=1160509 RepID=A0A3N4I5K4_ASCIM|nr:hypothetical protein BJ508DRAFT_310405 [Ascobolus immersus RN42]